VLVVGDRPAPVDFSLWTVNSLDKSAGTVANSVSPLDQAALRLDRLASIVESATAVAAEASAPDGDNWRQAWSSIVRGILTQTQETRMQPTAGPAVAQVSRSSEDQLDQAMKRLETWLQQAGTPAEGSAATNPLATSSWTLPSLSGSPVTWYVAEGGDERLIVDSIRHEANVFQGRMLPILAVAGLAALIAFLINSPIAVDLLCRWPHVIGVLLGIGWWAWLSPSWLGLAIVAATVWLSLRFDWPGRSYRAEASTVLRSTRTL
jgi:hypothetical protein